jgi:hypothetical protein
VAWHPLITDGRRDSIARVVREIVVALDAAPASVPGDHADRALLRTYVAQDELVPDPGDAAGAALALALGALPAAGPSLFGGTLGIGWTVAHVTGGEIADQVCSKIDRGLQRRFDASGSEGYDLVSGLVGLGVYAIERGKPGRDLALRILERLEQRAIPRLGGLAWHTAPELLPRWQRELAPEGYWNLGLAHGTPGVIGLLARYLVAELDPPRTRRLLDGAVAFMLAVEPPSPTGRYSSWHVGGAATDASTRDAHPVGRAAWCYGDLGVALALLGAAQATGDDTWRAAAIELGSGCATRSLETMHANDAGLCHGAFGNAHLFDRLRCATDDPRFSQAARAWLEHGLAMRTDQPIAGFPSLEKIEGVESWRADSSLLTGAAGVGLVLHSMISEQEPAWDRVLLVDVAC